MTPITFKRNSWHVWLVEVFTPTYAESCTDLCQYLRWVIFALLFGTFLTGAFSFFAILIGCGIIFDIEWLFGLVKWLPAKQAGWMQTSAVVFHAALGTSTVITVLIYVISKKEKNTSSHKEPGFIKLAYRSFRDKVCHRVEFE